MKKQWIHLQNKKRELPNDFDRISNTQATLSKLGYTSFRGQVLHSKKFTARERHPDLIVNLNGEIIPVELDGSVHGNGDEITESDQTKYRNDDYFKAGFLPIVVNNAWLQHEKISEEIYLKCVLFNLSQILRAKRRVWV